MNREAFIKIMNGKIKLIRTEYGLTQDKMALILGISKKTLIEIEKNRKSWADRFGCLGKYFL